jgi:lysyl-tRNA synthetase class 2
MDSIVTLSAKVREYFQLEAVREVKTPCLSRFSNVEPNIANFSILKNGEEYFLRTSPESALKQIVCKNEIDIFEIGPVFRDDESGENHLSEFTMLEWYRIDMSYRYLMDDVARLLNYLGLSESIKKLTYDELFVHTFGFSSHDASFRQLKTCAEERGLVNSGKGFQDRAYLLEFLTTCLSDANLKTEGLVFVYDYPQELRCYSQLSSYPKTFAKRFELFWDGLELANGYQEILSEEEQRACFESENRRRALNGLAEVQIDEAWLASLRRSELKTLSGVALGLERVLMIINGIKDIRLLPDLDLK